MANISISQMNTRAEANLSDLHEVAYADGNSQTGYASGKMTMEVMANAIVNGFTYQSLGNKKISKAIEDAEVTVDTALDPTSTNAVQNKAIAHELAGGNTQASGDVVTITDGSNLALTSATSILAPIQDLHGYSNPWVGGAGKNKIVYPYIDINTPSWNGMTITNDNGKLTVAGTQSGVSLYYFATVSLKQGVTYTINPNYIYSAGSTSMTLTVYDFSKSKLLANTNNTPVTFTCDDDYNARVYLNPSSSASGLSFDFTVQPQLEVGTQATAYEPYSNICPISGYDSAEYTRTGVNIFGGTYNELYSLYIKKGTSFVASCNVAVDTVRFGVYDVNGNQIDYWNVSNAYEGRVYRSFTLSYDVYGVKFFNATTTDMQITLNQQGTIYQPYYPYQAQNVTLTFDNTVYSGVIDWISGVVTVDKAMVDLGTLTYNRNDANNVYVSSLTNGVTGVINTKPNMICSNYEIVGSRNFVGFTDYQCTLVAGTSSIGIKDPRYSNASDFKTAMDGVQLLYELATPTTIQLTPTQLKTLAGYNTIYTDVGNISIAYQPNNVIAECKEYTDNAIPTVDSELDDTSLNPIANKPVAEAIADIVGDISDIDSNIEGSKQLTTTGNVITVSDSAATYLEELEVEIEPIQDLHGYNYPWVGGAGKNLLPMTVSGIKSANTSGTWSGNVYTLNNVTFELLVDSANNVTGIKVNGTASDATNLTLYDATTTYNAGSYILSGCPSGGSASTYNLNLFRTGESLATDTGSGASVNSSGADKRHYFFVSITNGTTITTPIIFYPMIRLSSITDSTFAPYSNICPITGYDDVSVQTTDEEETTTNTITATFDNTVYSGHVDFTNGVVTVDKGYIASYNGETLTGAWISDRDVYTSGGTPTTGAEVVYELATPQTIQLTPQQLQMLKGYNTVTTDANGGMTIKYQPDNVVGEIKAYASRLYDDILDRLEALSE